MRAIVRVSPFMKISPIGQDIWLVEVLGDTLNYAMHVQEIELFSRQE
jgi:hypothetical protein